VTYRKSVKMMWNLNLLLYFGTLASAAVLDRRQGLTGVGPNGKKQIFGLNFDLERVGPPLNAVSVVDAKARYRANSVRKLVRFGPIILPPAKVSAIRVQKNVPEANSTETLQGDMQIGNHSHGGSSGSAPSQPKTLADFFPLAGLPAITWDHVAKAYQQSILGDYEGAMSTMLHVPADREGSVEMRTLKGGFCSNCTVLRIKADIVYENGTRMDISNGVYLHHAVSFGLAWRENANWLNICPIENQWMKDVDLFSYLPGTFTNPLTIFGNAAVDQFQQWYGSPKEDAPNAGYYISLDDFFMMQSEMINYTKDEKKLYMEFDYEFLPGKIGKESTFTILSTLGK
jgi:hypothetical protein